MQSQHVGASSRACAVFNSADWRRSQTSQTAPRVELDDVVDAVCAASVSNVSRSRQGSQARDLVAVRRADVGVGVAPRGASGRRRTCLASDERGGRRAREFFEELDGLSNDVVQRVGFGGLAVSKTVWSDRPLLTGS
jgi:hypothetical protein